MTYTLTFCAPNMESLQFEIQEGRFRIGRSNNNQIVLPHSEVGPCVAELECRGDTMLLKNLNTFPIYVGSQELLSNALTEWSPAEGVQLTRNVKLTLARQVEEAAAESETPDRQKRARSTVQIAIIAACGLAGFFMLGASSEPSSQQRSQGTFAELMVEFDEKMEVDEAGQRVAGLTAEERIMHRYLRQAWVADRRWGMSEPNKAVAAYEVLLNYRPIRTETELDSLPGRVKSLAMHRVDKLGLRSE